MMFLISTYLKELNMSREIERLKRDKRETLYYQRRLLKRGKSDLAYKMQKKIDYMTETIRYMQAAS